VLHVPVQARFFQGEQAVVFVRDGQTISLRNVELGLYNESWIEIRSGVTEGEVVLMSAPPGYELTDAPPPAGRPAEGDAEFPTPMGGAPGGGDGRPAFGGARPSFEGGGGGEGGGSGEGRSRGGREGRGRPEGAPSDSGGAGSGAGRTDSDAGVPAPAASGAASSASSSAAPSEAPSARVQPAATEGAPQ